MDARLLSAAEKAANRRGRARRKAQGKARRRRERLLRTLVTAAGEVGTSVADLLTPMESLELLTAHLHRSRTLASRIKRKLAPTRTVESPVGPPVKLVPIVRPTRVLRAGRRSQVRPQLLDATVSDNHGSTMMEALAATKRHVDRGISPLVALDFFVGSTGLPWSVSAELLFRHGAIPTRISPDEVDATESARAFWKHYRDGRNVYWAAVTAREIQANVGDWALFHPGDLDALLPGIRLPRILRRQAYLVNLAKDQDGLCLDLYSCPTKLPLIRHPFTRLAASKSGA